MAEITSSWTLVYDRFEPSEQGLREALCTLGNGYLGVRGSFPENTASKMHYPGMYIAGVFNQLPTHVAGKTIYNEDMVNCPNWTFMIFKIGNGTWINPSGERILYFRQELDMRRGILTRKMRIKDSLGRKTYIETSRITHMADPHIVAMKYLIVPENYSENITVRGMLDGAVLNTGVERYRQLSNDHLDYNAAGGFGRNGIYLSMKTTRSNVVITEASRTRVFCADKELKPTMFRLIKRKERIGQEFKIYAQQLQKYEIEKTVSIYTSRDKGITDTLNTAISAAQSSKRFKVLLETHQSSWEQRWKKFDIKLNGDEFSQKVLRLHMFHLLQTASSHNKDIDAGFPARGLHGEAYRGHVFWDEIFGMPFYDFHNPEISQALLVYRYERINKAREYARKNGYKGAMFPWQSGSTGKEETQVLHLNPLSGKWGPDSSRIQRHVSFAIAYNVWQHYERSGDLDFLVRYGAEIILSIAQFCASLVKYDEKDNRYHTEGLMGPDEFHEKLPGADKSGFKDNAYSNFMIAWTLLKAKKLISILPEDFRNRIFKKIKLGYDELELWDKIARKMNIIIDKNGVISQFEGYFKLKDLDLDSYRKEYGNIGRMDRILKAEGLSPNKYKVLKQADVLMIFYLIQMDEIGEIFKHLGYKFDKNTLRKNYDYYVKRTSHGSTLSKVVHSYVALMLKKPKEAWKLYKEALESDIYDSQGGTTPEGIHAGVMGGTIDIVLRGFAGVNTNNNQIGISPNLPKYWNSVKLKFRYRNKWVSLRITKSNLAILIHEPMRKKRKIDIMIQGKLHSLSTGKKYDIRLKK